MKQILVLAALVSGLLSSTPCMAGFMSYPGSNFGGIADGIAGSVENYGPPRDIYFDVNTSPGTVSGLDVFFTATHTWVGDLRVTLIAPNGKRHLIFARTGATTATGFGYGSNLDGSYEFFSTGGNWWAAALAANPTNSTIPPNFYQTVVSGGAGVSAPAPGTNMAAAFAGIPANGRWILRFEDGASGDTGAVTAAHLSVDTVGIDRVVSNADNDGGGSLRAAMLAAANGDHITFDPTFFAGPRVINLETALPIINTTLAIEGPGAHRLTVQRAYNVATDFRIFAILGGTAGVSLSGMTLSNGRTSEFSGAINSASHLTLSGMNITGNRAGTGGGVWLEPVGGSFINSSFSGNSSDSSGAAIFAIGNASNINPLQIRNCTFSGNRAGAFGGAIGSGANSPGATLVVEIVNSTIAENIAFDGGGISTSSNNGAASSQVLLRNSIVAGNLPGNFKTQTTIGSNPAVITSQGFNLSDNYNGIVTMLSSDLVGDPKLGPLALNGGSTPTRLLLGGSPAIDAGRTSGSAIDQRGTARLLCQAPLANGSDCGDIGAVEMQYLMVTTTADAGLGSLRAAITAANANGPDRDDIIFDPGVFNTPQTIPLASQLPSILKAMTISGPGADRLSLRRADDAPDFRILSININAPLAVSGLTLENGRDVGFFGSGGAILSSSPLTLAGVHVKNNQATIGGGVYLSARQGSFVGSTFSGNIAGPAGGGLFLSGDSATTVPSRYQVSNSTVSGNSTTDGSGFGGAGIFVGYGLAHLDVVNSTIANNTSQSEGGGIETVSNASEHAVVTTLRNSIFADNLPNDLDRFRAGGTADVLSRGFNLAGADELGFLNQPGDMISINAGLGALSSNGGPIPTHALLPGSVAIDAGNNQGSGVLHDQRDFGYGRPADLTTIPNASGGDGSDMGAFELQDRIFASGFDN